MPIEIERKFLVRDASVVAGCTGERLRQGYLCQAGPESAVIVRVRIAGAQAWLTLKSATSGVTRAEFEYPIPLDDADALLALSPWPAIDKTRYRLAVDDHLFEIDVFHGGLAPLVVAEIELDAADAPFPRPDWLGQEVSDDPRYRNSELALRLASGEPPPA